MWNGISAVRVNCGTAIVGTPEQVVDELLGYWRLGVDEFILSGYPHLEECQRIAETVLPRLNEAIRQEPVHAWRAAADLGTCLGLCAHASAHAAL